MIGWYQRAKKRVISYDREMAFLRNYLKQGFDPYDYGWLVEEFLENEGFGVDDDFDGNEWVEKATPQQLEEFKEWAEDKLQNVQEDTTTPAYRHFDYERIQTPGWLVHFTDDAFGVAWKGFLYGHEEVEGLGLTTWKGESSRKKYASFNFALDADSKYATWAANSHKYGKDAVVFWGSGVLAYHHGDEEGQVIFWGPSVKTDMIFPIYFREGEWVVEGEDGRVMVQGEFDTAVNWIQNNYRMLQQIRQRDNRRRGQPRS